MSNLYIQYWPICFYIITYSIYRHGDGCPCKDLHLRHVRFKFFLFMFMLWQKKRLFFILLREDHFAVQTCPEKHSRLQGYRVKIFAFAVSMTTSEVMQTCSRHVAVYITEVHNGPVCSSGCAHLHLESLTLCLFSQVLSICAETDPPTGSEGVTVYVILYRIISIYCIYFDVVNFV